MHGYMERFVYLLARMMRSLVSPQGSSQGRYRRPTPRLIMIQAAVRRESLGTGRRSGDVRR
jgi:hypothetical protein